MLCKKSTLDISHVPLFQMHHKKRVSATSRLHFDFFVRAALGKNIEPNRKREKELRAATVSCQKNALSKSFNQ
jgi:hypothetical protein